MCQWANSPADRRLTTFSHAQAFTGWCRQSLELAHGPPDDVLVDAPREGLQPGAIEGPVVVDPASYVGVDLPREVGQVRSAAALQVPVLTFLPTAFIAVSLIAGLNPTKNRWRLRTLRARKPKPRKSKLVCS